MKHLDGNSDRIHIFHIFDKCVDYEEYPACLLRLNDPDGRSALVVDFSEYAPRAAEYSGMETQTFRLTVDEFLRGPQELILLRRHGRGGDVDRPSYPAVGADIRSAIKEALRAREIRCRVKFEVGDAVIELRSDDLYEHEGRLCKIIFLHRREAQDRKLDCEPPELQSLRLAGWVADHHFANSPAGLRIYYHVFGKGGADAQIKESWYREFPLAPEEDIRALVTDRTRQLSEALSLPDDALPECSQQERTQPPRAGYSKCRDWCPARQHCHQMHRFYAAATERYLAGERALESIDPGA